MYIIRPIAITDAMLTSSNVAETDYGAYAAGTTYATGDKCIVTTVTGVEYHRIYESLVDSNTGNFPPDNPTEWLDIGATNRWRVFDERIQDQTSNASTIEYVLTPGSLDSIAFFNLDATTITLDLTSGGVSRYSATITLAGATKAVKTDLPAGYPAGILSITITKTGTPKCGEIVMGLKFYIGKTLREPIVGMVDFSIKQADQWGNSSVVERSFSSLGEFDLGLLNTIVDAVFAMLVSYRAAPLVFVASELYQTMIHYGFHVDFRIRMHSAARSNMQLKVQGLT